MRRPLLLGVLIYAITFLALLTFNGPLLILAIPLVLLLGMGLYYGPGELPLQATRTLSRDRTGEGLPVVVTLAVTNTGAAYLEEVVIEESPPLELRVSDSDAREPTATRFLTALAPGETVTLTYTVQGQCGEHAFGEVHAAAHDHFGLFQHEGIVPATGEDSLYVLPTAIKLKRIAIRPRQTLVYAGATPARVGGAGTEFYGVRPYQPSDSPRHINWRANARHPGSLFTTEFQQERIADVGLILDARRRADIASRDRALFEYSVQATAALAETFLQDGHRVGLLRYGGVLDWTYPGYGKQQRERILRTLARAETGESLVFDRLEYLPTRFFPAKSQIVLVSPLCLEDLDPLIYLRGRGYEVLIVSPNPVAFERRFLPDTPTTALATRVARIERSVLLRRLRQAGIRIVDWDVALPLQQAVAMSLARQPIWARPLGVIP
jgi:uncharacterized protein (DUF58 family)